MSFTSGHPQLCKIHDDLTKELDIFTNGKNTTSVKRIVNTLFDMDLRKLIKVLLTVRHFNKHDSLRKGDHVAKVYFKYFNQLIMSRNNLDDADAHPVGQDLSIFSCAAKSQSALNVKRLNVNNADNRSDGSSALLKFVVNELGFKNKCIEPSINDSSIHSNPITWFRLKLRGGPETLFETFKSMYASPIVHVGVADVHLLYEEGCILEIYYEKGVKKSQILLHFEACEFVEKIIFCSELNLLKKVKARPCDIFSNIIKFNYCNKTKNIDFCLTCQDDLLVFHYVYLMSAMLLTSTSSSPISGISCSKPMFKSMKNAKELEPITDYERKHKESRGAKAISDTAATPETEAIGQRHKVHAAVQDRDRRILSGASTMGGTSVNELVIHSKKAPEIIKILQSMS